MFAWREGGRGYQTGVLGSPGRGYFCGGPSGKSFVFGRKTGGQKNIARTEWFLSICLGFRWFLQGQHLYAPTSPYIPPALLSPTPLPLLPPPPPLHPLPLPLPRHVQFTSFLRVSLVGGESWARSGKGVLTPEEMKGNWNQDFELEGSETRDRVGRMHPHQIGHTPFDLFKA